MSSAITWDESIRLPFSFQKDGNGRIYDVTQKTYLLRGTVESGTKKYSYRLRVIYNVNDSTFGKAQADEKKEEITQELERWLVSDQSK